MDVVDAESLDDCAEGEYKTRRKSTDRAFNKDITDRDGCGTLRMTRDSFYLDPMWCAHTGNVRMMCATRKCVVHASSWVFCVHRPVAFSELRLAGREKQLKKIVNLDGGQISCFLLTCFLEIDTAISFLRLVQLSLEHKVNCCLPIF